MTFSRLTMMAIAGLAAAAGSAAAGPEAPRAYGLGVPFSVQQLPDSRLRADLKALPPGARDKALKRLGTLRFPAKDTAMLRVDRGGALFYEDPAIPARDRARRAETARSPSVGEATISVDPSKVFTLHSRPGASRVVYLNFLGGEVTGTAWNASSKIASHPMLAYSEDSDRSTLSQAEANTIAETWKRIAEDYAPFDIDVTTERPASFGPTVGHLMFSPRIDANGQAIYPNAVGGVAYVGVFGASYFTYYQPALVFPEGVGLAKGLTEAGSHELGHNLGLSHDGTASYGYYGGHGAGNVSWGPIMGVGYYTNVTQWSKGEYSGANNQQDDLAIIAQSIPYRAQDRGQTLATATPLVVVDGVVTAHTPVSDPFGVMSAANRGVIETAATVDWFVFDVPVGGTVDLTVSPVWLDGFVGDQGRSANLDIKATLYRASGSGGSIIATDDQPTDTYARITKTVLAGRHYLAIEGVGRGDPLSDGYTDYGSVGQYYISGTVPSGSGAHRLTVVKQGAGAGTVASSPSGIACGSACTADYANGTTVTLTATAASGSGFDGWSGACTGTNPVCSVAMSEARQVTASFGSVPPPVKLSVEVSGSGKVTSSPAGINCVGLCEANFAAGAQVKLTATAASGATFTGWSGACTGANPVCTVSMTGNASVTASFGTQPTVEVLTVKVAGLGTGTVVSDPIGINCGATCQANFARGRLVKLVAKPATGSAFSGWTGACTGKATTCEVTMSQARLVSAGFVRQKMVTVSVVRSGVGFGTVVSPPAGISCGQTCSTSVPAGTLVRLQAVPTSSSAFSFWDGACSGRALYCSVTADKALSATAVFARTTGTLVSIRKTGGGNGVVTSMPAAFNCGAVCAARFARNTQVTLKAVPATGSVFLGWTGVCSGGSPTPVPTCTVTVGTVDATAVAVFRLSTAQGTASLAAD